MIKGISRQIIEVQDTQNQYFEKAWLVLKPEYSNVGANKVEFEADSYLRNLKPPYSLRNNRGVLAKAVSLGSAMLGGGLITAVLYQCGVL